MGSDKRYQQRARDVTQAGGRVAREGGVPAVLDLHGIGLPRGRHVKENGVAGDGNEGASRVLLCLAACFRDGPAHKAKAGVNYCQKENSCGSFSPKLWVLKTAAQVKTLQRTAI